MHHELTFAIRLSTASLITRPTDTVMNVNISYDDMMKPVVGPENPFAERRFQNQNTISGLCLLLL